MENEDLPWLRQLPEGPSSSRGKLHTINIEASGAAGSVLVLEEQTVPGLEDCYGYICQKKGYLKVKSINKQSRRYFFAS